MTHHDLALLARESYTAVPDFKAGTMHGIIRDIGTTRVVAVAGTDSAKDWIRHNLRMGIQQWWLGLRCHAGFADAANLIIRDRTIRDYVPNSIQRLVFCGHSLGGAVAQLLGVYYAADEVVTFGSPRVFDAESAAKAKMFRGGHLLFRYCHRDDPVPMVPFPHWGYRHVGEPWWWDGQGWKRRMDPMPTVRTMADGLLRFYGFVVGSIRDHGTRNYIAITKGTQ